MAAPISLSPNYCGIRISGEDALFHNEWNSLEDIILDDITEVPFYLDKKTT
jgi:hypothetical protein